MKKIRNCLVLFSLLFISSNAFAEYGCYIQSSGLIYTSPQGGSGKWRSSPVTNIGTNACLLGGGAGPSCEVSGVGYGVLGDYDVTYCPIDEYVWVLLAGSSLVAMGFIRKRIA